MWHIMMDPKNDGMNDEDNQITSTLPQFSLSPMSCIPYVMDNNPYHFLQLLLEIGEVLIQYIQKALGCTK